MLLQGVVLTKPFKLKEAPGWQPRRRGLLRLQSPGPEVVAAGIFFRRPGAHPESLLLLRRQRVFEADHQRQRRAFDPAFEVEDGFELVERLLLPAHPLASNSTRIPVLGLQGHTFEQPLPGIHLKNP